MTTTPQNLSAEKIEFYRRNGFVHIPQIITREEAGHFRKAAVAASERLEANSHSSIFRQCINVWCHDEEMRRLTMHPNVAGVATRLAGVRLRLWHDQILIKAPKNSTPTEFHQDQPYWPHANSANPLSIWIALCDVPVERGCMTFIPGSQRWNELPPQNLSDPQSLMQICPELQWEPRVTVPLRAGDCTFHHGRVAHMATPNLTDEPRVAHVVIFMDEATTYVAKKHPITDPLGLKPGEALDHELFPLLKEPGLVG